MKKLPQTTLVFSLALFSILLVSPDCPAGTAKILPKGIHRVELQNKYWFPMTQGYDKDGERKDLSAPFNIALDGSVLPPLAILEAAAGMPSGSATLGVTDIDLSMQYYDMILFYQYGLTDRVTIGAEIPYYWQWTDLKRATVNTQGATVGLNPGTQGPPLLPTSAGGVANDSLAMELLQGSLEQLGYKRLEDWSDSGLGDIVAGLRYQYLDQAPFQLAVTTGVTLPTGEVDDPDNLLDIEFGEGAWNFFVNTNNDYSPTSDLTLNGTLRYYYYFTSSQTRRIPEGNGSMISARKESVDVQLGDQFEVELTATYDMTEAWSFEAMYRYAYRDDDSVDGDLPGFDYSLMEHDTFKEEQVGRVGLSYSTLPAFKRGEASLPLTAALEYRDRFAGRNALVSRYIRLNIVLFF